MELEKERIVVGASALHRAAENVHARAGAVDRPRIRIAPQNLRPRRRTIKYRQQGQHSKCREAGHEKIMRLNFPAHKRDGEWWALSRCNNVCPRSGHLEIWMFRTRGSFRRLTPHSTTGDGNFRDRKGTRLN